MKLEFEIDETDERAQTPSNSEMRNTEAAKESEEIDINWDIGGRWERK